MAKSIAQVAKEKLDRDKAAQAGNPLNVKGPVGAANNPVPKATQVGHTPGYHWRIAPDDPTIIMDDDGDHHAVAEVYGNGYPDAQDKAAYIVRAVNSAPALLAACEYLMGILTPKQLYGKPGESEPAGITLARAALALAKP